jgi:hypothetical protein
LSARPEAPIGRTKRRQRRRGAAAVIVCAGVMLGTSCPVVAATGVVALVTPVPTVVAASVVERAADERAGERQAAPETPGRPSNDPATFVDAVLADVEAQTLTASDVALARALGALGFSPTTDPIDARDVDRMIHARLELAEAQRLGIDAGDEEIDRAWEVIAQALGGRAALDVWLEDVGVARDAARMIVRQDLRLKSFVELRFRAFAFVSEEEVDAAGAGRTPAERDRVRNRLRAEKADRELGAWLEAEMRRASIRRVLAPGDRVPCPLPMPRR